MYIYLYMASPPVAAGAHVPSVAASMDALSIATVGVFGGGGGTVAISAGEGNGNVDAVVGNGTFMPGVAGSGAGSWAPGIEISAMLGSAATSAAAALRIWRDAATSSGVAAGRGGAEAWCSLALRS